MILTIVILLALIAIFITPFIYLSYQCTEEAPHYELDKYLGMSKEKQRKYLINKYLRGVTVPKGYIVAFKGFRSNMTCLNNFKYREGETYTIDGTPITCSVGFHACLMPRDVANYYYTKGCKFHIVFLKDIDPYTGSDSKKCAKTIKIGPRIPSDFIV